jgi:hypothetical protein
MVICIGLDDGVNGDGPVAADDHGVDVDGEQVGIAMAMRLTATTAAH